jgi:histidinol-phosphatase (PHP family)
MADSGGLSVIDRQARNLPLDAHLHSNLSPDSDVEIDAYAEQALERGIDELAITDHVDFEPGTPAYGASTFAEREAVVRDASDRWAPRGVAIRFGVELTYDRRYEADLRDHLRRHAYDFVIGSVHVYRSSPYASDRVAGFVADKRLSDVVAPYFDEVEAAARSGLFDVVGHIDFVKRYLHPHVTPAHLAAAPELYDPILRALIDTGTALEVNTSGLRQVAGETYPSPAIVARFRELGGARVTVGSDAHRVNAFAWGLADGYDHVRNAGFAALSIRRGGAPESVPLERQPNAAGVRSL